MKSHWVFLALLAGLPACKKNPINRLVDPVPDGAVQQSSGLFIIYDDEMKTGGGLGLIPAGDNQAIDLLDHSEPRLSSFAIRYTWNGGDIPDPTLNITSHTFAGFSLLVSPDFTTFGATPAKDLSAPGYTKLTFWIRGSLSLNNSLRVEGPTDGVLTAARLDVARTDISSTDWTKMTLSVPTATHFNAVKIFATFSIQYDEPPRSTLPGEGGTIYLDRIQYER